VRATLKYDKGVFLEVPRQVMQVDDRLSPFGGIQGVTDVCMACPANTTPELPESLGACCGILDISPDDMDWEKRLRKEMLAQRAFEKWQQHFLPTSPTWYGLWEKSPLSPAQCELLLQFLEGVFDMERDFRRGLMRFMNALRKSLETGLHLFVHLDPPGHTSQKFRTVYPHCPRCKAEAKRGEKWQGRYSALTYECPVCNFAYVQPAIQSVEEWEGGETNEAAEIFGVLGPVGARAFIRTHMLRHGANEDQISRVLASGESPITRAVME